MPFEANGVEHEYVVRLQSLVTNAIQAHPDSEEMASEKLELDLKKDDALLKHYLDVMIKTYCQSKVAQEIHIRRKEADFKARAAASEKGKSGGHIEKIDAYRRRTRAILNYSDELFMNKYTIYRGQRLASATVNDLEKSIQYHSKMSKTYGKSSDFQKAVLDEMMKLTENLETTVQEIFTDERVMEIYRETVEE